MIIPIRDGAVLKTGCLITADGSKDSKIQPEGLKDYSIPPPLLVASLEQPMQCLMMPKSTAEEPSGDLESGYQEPLCMDYEEVCQQEEEEEHNR